MPDNLQLYANRVRIQPETATGQGGDDSDVFAARLTGAGIVRDIGEHLERVDPWLTREFSDPKNISWGIELAGELRADSLLFWILEKITVAGTAERGFNVREIRANAAPPETFAVQFDGIEGTSTFYGCALTQLAVKARGRRPVTFSLSFAGLTRDDSESAWSETTTETGDIVASKESRVSLASDFGGLPDSYEKTTYEAAIQISRDGVAASDFSPDGIPRGHTPGNQWDMVGRLLIPETAEITDGALDLTWNGNLNFRTTDTAGEHFEIDAPIVGAVNRRTGLSYDWKQAAFEFVSRRGATDSVARFIQDF